MDMMGPTADDMADMAMTLNTGYENYILFEGFKTTSGGIWLGAIVFIALLAFLSETSGYILGKY